MVNSYKSFTTESTSRQQPQNRPGEFTPEAISIYLYTLTNTKIHSSNPSDFEVRGNGEGK